VAADRRKCDAIVHTHRRLFFSAPLQADKHSMGITKDATKPGNGHEPGEPIEILKHLEFRHHESMTGFLEEEKDE
jgi:hypothetical protein